jgi:hypothetical protein
MRQAIIFIFIILVVSSCKTSSDVINGRKFQKRKYTSGWYVQHNNKQDKRQQVHDSIEESTSATTSSDKKSSVESSSTSGDLEDDQVNVDSRTYSPEEEEAQSTNVTADLATTISVGESSKPISSYEEFGLSEKKKKRKEKMTALTLWGWNSIAVASWLIDWPVHLPYIALPLIALGMILLIMSLTKLKKNQRKNKFRCYVGIFIGILLIIVTIVLW